MYKVSHLPIMNEFATMLDLITLYPKILASVLIKLGKSTTPDSLNLANCSATSQDMNTPNDGESTSILALPIKAMNSIIPSARSIFSDKSA